MDSKVIKSHQCSLERSRAVLIEINSEFWSRLGPFYTKTDLYRSASHKNLQNQNNEDLFNQLLCVWLHSTNSNFPVPIFIEEILDQPIFLNEPAKLHAYAPYPSLIRALPIINRHLRALPIIVTHLRTLLLINTHLILY